MGMYNEDSINRYEVIESLGQKSLIITNDLSCIKSKTVFEVYIKEADYAKNGTFVVKIITNGVTEDVKLNGWLFSFCTKGSYKIKSCQYPHSFNFTIRGIMPNGQPFEKRLTYDYCEVEPFFLVKEIFRLLAEISSCSTLEDFEILQSLAFSKIGSFQELVKACNAVEKARTKLSVMKSDEGGSAPFYLQLKQKMDETFAQVKENIAHLQPIV